MCSCRSIVRWGSRFFILVVIRFANRLVNPPPPFPPTMSRMERLGATASEYAMYGLMFVLPLVGWGMLSAARYPIVLFGSLHLPFILPHDAALFAGLRKAHTILAYLFILMFLAHFGAILYHTLIVRDGLLMRMVPWNIRPDQAISQKSPDRLVAESSRPESTPNGPPISAVPDSGDGSGKAVSS